MPDRQPLIIVGASVRAAAQSAVRAGFAPWCIDQFADQDLAEIADEVRIITDWPGGITDVFQDSPQADWLYTGALENAPELVKALSRQRRLLGGDDDVLTRVRDPRWIAATLQAASLPCLPIIGPAASLADLQPLLADRKGAFGDEWLVKPLASAAGIGICRWNDHELQSPETTPSYLQKQAHGQVISGLYLGCEGTSQLLGLCDQLCGHLETGASEFLYGGSLGPLSTDDVAIRTFEQAQQISRAIAQRAASENAALMGLFGIDFILDEDGDLWTLELNPRYPASAELYERVFGWPLMQWHVDACRGSGANLPGEIPRGDSGSSAGKLIIYAPGDIVAPNLASMLVDFNLATEADLCIADIPRADTQINKGQPVCTLLVTGSRISRCRETLLSAATAFRKLLSELEH